MKINAWKKQKTKRGGKKDKEQESEKMKEKDKSVIVTLVSYRTCFEILKKS